MFIVFGSSLFLAACVASDKDGTSETDQAVTSTTQTVSVPFQLATPAPMHLGGFQIGGGALTLAITAQAGWRSTVNTDFTWDSDKVRQGATVAVGRDIKSITGTIGVRWSLSGNLDLGDVLGHDHGFSLPIATDQVSCVPNLTPQATGGTGVGGGGGGGIGGGGGAGGTGGPGAVQTTFSPCGSDGDSGACFGVLGDDGSVAGGGGTTTVATAHNDDYATTTNALADGNNGGTGDPSDLKNQMLGSLGGQYIGQAAEVDANLPSFTCTADGTVTLFETQGIPNSPYFKLRMQAQFKIVQQKATTSSQFLIAGAQVAQANLDLTPTPASESLAMPCDKPTNSDVQYAIGNVDWQPATFVTTQQAFLTVGILDQFIGVGEEEIFSAPITNPIKQALKVDLTATGSTIDLGPLQANNVLPTVTAGPFSGTEGTPVTLSETATSACPITSYAWNFSNGGTAFGPNPSVLFGQHGQYSGQIVVTDSTHLSQTADFNASISNVAPTALAGPSTSGAWGTQIALVGQGSDPGGDPLTYAWNFGDGTQGVGGTTAQHAYAAPGDYVATFTVCDDLNACVSATTPVHVRARRTSVAFTGTNTGVYSAQAPLSGAIVDELGLPVVGGLLAFTLGGNAAGSAQTDSTGVASSQQTIGLPAGSYATTATFGGTTFYTGGSTSGSFAVTRMGSTVQYMGATTSTANKTISLSAMLADALGRPLAGKTVVFQLGTQQAQGVTNANGVASTTLSLSQHNGSYPLTTTWTPAGTDATEWTGTAIAGTFVIGNK